MKRIPKVEARKLFNAGKTVYLLPSKVGTDSMWVKPHGVNNRDEQDFEKVINAYRYYNCNIELGRGLHYYVEE